MTFIVKNNIPKERFDFLLRNIVCGEILEVETNNIIDQNGKTIGKYNMDNGRILNRLYTKRIS